MHLSTHLGNSIEFCLKADCVAADPDLNRIRVPPPETRHPRGDFASARSTSAHAAAAAAAAALGAGKQGRAMQEKRGAVLRRVVTISQVFLGSPADHTGFIIIVRSHSLIIGKITPNSSVLRDCLFF